MAKPVVLTDAQESLIVNAGTALSPQAREILRMRVIEQLRAEPEIGDGAVWRVVKSVQRDLWTAAAPLDDGRHRGTAMQLRRFNR